MSRVPLRLALGVAVVLGAAPLAAPSHARCVPEWALVCSTLNVACHTAQDALPKIDLNCPYY